MTEPYDVSIGHSREDVDWQFIKGQIEAYNRFRQPALFDPDQTVPEIGVYVRDAEGRIVGGAIAEVEWENVHIEFLWVDETLRGQGIGTRVLRRIEEGGRAAGATWASVTTYSFQAPQFYRKHGYRVIGQMDGLPPGHTWFLFRRDFDR
jgi:GNAT superfamily N-acetyltransferase